MSIPPPVPLAYEGAVSIPYINRTFSPLPTNNAFSVPTIWINTAAGSAYILVGKALGVADWLLIGAGTGVLYQIDTPDGAQVFPAAGIIDFLNGSGMNITGSGNTITFNSTGGGFTWHDVTTSPQALAGGNGYVADSGSLITFTLPTTAAFGSTFFIAGHGTGGWTISQSSGQSIVVGTLTSTVGAGGSVASSNKANSVELVCIVANTTFKAIDWQGNLQVT